MKNTIKTFEDACKALGLDAAKLPIVSDLPEEMQKASVAHYKLMIIAKALNNGWEPDWTNSRQYKYYPWFDMSSGSGLSYYVYSYSHSYAYVSSRLCFETAELATYAGQQFEALYQDYLSL